MDASQLPSHADSFVHVRIIIGIVTGLSVTRLLTGLARFVQHPGRDRIYSVHFGWVLTLFLGVIHFWWFEFGLFRIGQWTFELYFFILCYAALFFFICAILFPEKLDEYDGFEDYFHSRQKWFYGLIAALFLVDIADTGLKGVEHLRQLGPGYLIRQVALCVLAVIAMFVTNRLYHQFLVGLALTSAVALILWQFDVLS